MRNVLYLLPFLSMFIGSNKKKSADAQAVRADIFRVEPVDEAAARRIFYKATDHFNAARWDEAVELFKAAYEINSHYRGSALFLSGLILERSGDLEEGARQFWSAVQVNDIVNSAAQTRVGLIFGRSGETERALEAFNNALKADKENVMAKRNRIVALRNLGRAGLVPRFQSCVDYCIPSKRTCTHSALRIQQRTGKVSPRPATPRLSIDYRPTPAFLCCTSLLSPLLRSLIIPFLRARARRRP